MARISRKDLKTDEFVDAAVDASAFLERHWRPIVGGIIAVAVLGMATIGWSTWARQRDARLEDRLGQGLSRFTEAERAGGTSDGYQAALVIFDEVLEQASTSPSGRIARYYRGAALHRLGRHDEAAAELTQVGSAGGSPDTLGTSARVLLVEVYREAGRTADALATLAVLESDPLFPPEEALLRQGWVHASAGNMDEARRSWQRLLDQFPQSPAAAEVTKILGPKAAGS